MKKVRKYSLCLLVIAFSVLCCAIQINVFASDAKYSNYGATYQIKEVVDEYDFGYGITFQRELSTSSITKNGLSSGVSLNVDSPQQASILTVTPSEEVLLVPYTFIDGGQWQALTVKKAALQYEASNPGYRVVAGVNGDFFAINEAVKASTGVTIGQGEYYKSISNHGAVNTLAIRNNGEGKQLFTANITKSYPILSIYDETGEVIKKFNIDKVNAEPGANEISVYYAQREKAFDRTLITEKASGVYFVKTGIAGCTSIKDSFYGVGVISEFVNGEVEVKQNQFAIKSNNQEVTDMLGTDVKIRVQYEYNDPSVAGVENFIGFPYQLVSNGSYIGKDHPDDNNVLYRHPRTIIGQKENGDIVLAVVDGRQTNKDMYGLTAVEMSTLMAAHGCVDAWNLDGGGSSTMIVRKQNGWDFGNADNGFNTDNSNWYVTNNPSDGGERSDGNHLLVVVKLPDVQIDFESADEVSVTLTVALLSEINKYSNLYILLNNEYHLVQDGKVTVTGLKKDTDYTAYLYAKEGENYINLMLEKEVSTDKTSPTSVQVSVSLFERNGVTQILFRYKVDKSEAVRKIVFVDESGENRYLTTSQTVTLEKTQEIYDMIKNGKIEITYIPNKHFPDEVLVLDQFDITFELMFMMDEMLFTFDNTMDDLFK